MKCPILSNGFTFNLEEGDLITETIRARGAWEPHLTDLFRNVVVPGVVVLDIGANFGFHTLELAARVGDSGRVLAFEPQRLVYQQLCHHLYINDCRNVWTYHAAIGDRMGTVAVASASEAIVGNVGATPVGIGSEYVPMITIDSLSLNALTLMKVDVQGAELLTLSGGKSTVEKFRPIIAIEVEESWLRRFQTSSKEVVEWLLARDYVVYRFETEWPTDCVAVPVERDLEVSALLKGAAWQTSRMQGREIELLFDEKPFWSSFRITKV